MRYGSRHVFMGGYEGEGTSGGGFNGGGDFANFSELAGLDGPAVDSNIAPSGVNTGLSIADQYGEYGIGRAASDLATGIGRGAFGYSDTAGTPAQQNSFLSGATSLTPAEQIGAAQPGIFSRLASGALSLLGLASGTPGGVVSGGRGLASLLSDATATPNAGRSSNLGFGSPEQSLGSAVDNGLTGPASNGFSGPPDALAGMSPALADAVTANRPGVTGNPVGWWSSPNGAYVQPGRQGMVAPAAAAPGGGTALALVGLATLFLS